MNKGELHNFLGLRPIKVAGFELLDLLGTGGNGVVYKAIHLQTNQLVAIKTALTVEKDQHSWHVQRLRLENEARICERLNHPNIVRLLDRNLVLNGMSALVYTLAGEQSLCQFLRVPGKIRPILIKRIMTHVLEALCYAHREEVIHGDVKPGNIMLSYPNGVVKAILIDFGNGCIQRVARRYKVSETKLPLSVGYCAPELLLGVPCSPKSDLYSWGVVLIECLLGRQLIPGNGLAEVIKWQLSSAEHDLSQMLSHTQLIDLFQQVLQKNPQKRSITPQTALEVFRSLDFSELDIPELITHDNGVDDTLDPG